MLAFILATTDDEVDVESGFQGSLPLALGQRATDFDDFVAGAFVNLWMFIAQKGHDIDHERSVACAYFENLEIGIRVVMQFVVREESASDDARVVWLQEKEGLDVETSQSKGAGRHGQRIVIVDEAAKTRCADSGST